MSTLPEGNPRLPEDINRSQSHPLKEFFVLLVAVALALVILAFGIGLLSQWLAPYIPFSWEASASGIVAEAVEDEFGEAGFTLQQQRAIDALGRELLRADRAAGLERGEGEGDEIPDVELSFTLVHSDMANAFASLGGHIYVTDALIEDISSENGLAMVLAHEIAHIKYRHPIKSSSSALVLQLALTAVLGHAGEGLLRQFLANTGVLTSMSFSRRMELQSDERALATLIHYYGHPLGADEFFRLAAGEERAPRWLEFARTHPSTDRRLKVIERSIREISEASGSLPALTPLPPSLAFDRLD